MDCKDTPSRTKSTIMQYCVNLGRQVARAAKFCPVEPNMKESSMWNFSWHSSSAHNFGWLLYFSKFVDAWYNEF